MIDTGVPLTIAGSDSGTGGQSLLNWDWHKCLTAGSDREQSLLNWYDTGVPLITGSVGQGAEPVELVWPRCPSDHHWLRWWDRGTEHVTLGLTQMSHYHWLRQCERGTEPVELGLWPLMHSLGLPVTQPLPPTRPPRPIFPVKTCKARQETRCRAQCRTFDNCRMWCMGLR